MLEQWAHMFWIMSDSFFHNTLSYLSLWYELILLVPITFVLHLLIWPQYVSLQSLLQTVDYDTFTPALWRLSVMTLIVVFKIFFSSLTIFLSSTTVVFFGLLIPWSVEQWLWLIFPWNSKWLVFSHRHLTLVFTLVFP